MMEREQEVEWSNFGGRKLKCKRTGREEREKERDLYKC